MPGHVVTALLRITVKAVGKVRPSVVDTIAIKGYRFQQPAPPLKVAAECPTAVARVAYSLLLLVVVLLVVILHGRRHPMLLLLPQFLSEGVEQCAVG